MNRAFDNDTSASLQATTIVVSMDKRVEKMIMIDADGYCKISPTRALTEGYH